MLKFRLAGIPVAVHLSFLILALFGLGRYDGIAEVAAWTGGVFLAILAHEAGHAFTARAFGAPGVRIMLFAFGGATTYPVTTRMTPGRRFLISAAGSAVGIASGAVLLVLASNAGWLDVDFSSFPPRNVRPDPVSALLLGYVEAALFWGVLNWIPMRPLDGGQMVQSLLEMVAPSIADAATRAVSLVVGVPIIIYALANQLLILAMFVGFLLFTGLRSPSPSPSRAPRSAASGPQQHGDEGAASVGPEGGDGGRVEPEPPGSDGQPHLPSRRSPKPSTDPPDFPI